MHAMLLRFGAWLGQKLVAAALIVLIALAGYGLWLFLQDEGLLDTRRVEKIQHAIADRGASAGCIVINANLDARCRTGARCCR